ncbi:MAG TPA: sigma-54 dependent transcriptional regulator [Bryobacteraceae bacterium]
MPALIGQSPRMRDLRALIQKLGRSESPVLLLGETGTGKEVAARAIHAARGSGPFIAIDCSLIGTLLESELFGHARGAFTGAVNTKPGLIEMAEGGTAFFDEIGELPVDMQAKLLRVLQEKEIRPLGSVTGRPARFRPIAATNRDLGMEVERGGFRRDLYYRLNVVKLRLPPLRERKQDIPELAEHFLLRYGASYSLSSEVMEALIRYDWPGNVRELENSIQHMVALNSGPWLHAGDLPSALQNSLAVARRREPHRPAGAEPAVERQRVLPLEELERQAIAEALAFTRGDRARAAALLGIGRTTLYRKMKRYLV